MPPAPTLYRYSGSSERTFAHIISIHKYYISLRLKHIKYLWLLHVCNRMGQTGAEIYRIWVASFLTASNPTNSRLGSFDGIVNLLHVTIAVVAFTIASFGNLGALDLI